eukprot:940482-Amorphochlora_amoeboformis.AAC.1
MATRRAVVFLAVAPRALSSSPPVMEFGFARMGGLSNAVGHAQESGRADLLDEGCPESGIGRMGDVKGRGGILAVLTYE